MIKRIKHIKYRYLLLFLLCCNVCSIYAQSADTFCGDWVGTYSITLPDPDSDGMKDVQYKLYIRINKHSTGYNIRLKSQGDDGKVTYWPTCENVSLQGSSLYFTMDRGYDSDWDDNDKKNGQTIKYSHYVIHSSISQDKGTLNYKDYLITSYYGDHGKIAEERSPIHYKFLRDLPLYRDDGW